MTKWPGAVAAALAFLLGVLLVQWLPRLPPPWCDGLLAGAALAAGWRWPRLRWAAVLCLGVAWAAWRGTLAMELRLPTELEGRDVEVVGVVDELPLARQEAAAFLLRVESASVDGKPIALHGRLRLAWYDDAPALQPCARWRLHLRLRRPRGLIDPGGADSERSALERRIAAVGYVRDDPENHPLGAPGWCLDGVRASIAAGIAARVRDPHDAALLRAFAVGDTRGLDAHDWEVARANGIPHLIAISGFHVGVAAVVGVWLAGLVFWLCPRLALRVPRGPVQALAAVVAAGGYSALAGFGLPTVRTLLMIAVVALARCSRRGAGGAQSLALALLAILLADPLAVLAAGFWLSFVGVAFLMLCLATRAHGLRGFLRELSLGQLVMTVSLLPLTQWFFGESSLVGLLANLVAVPFVSFVIVPMALLGMALLLLCQPAAAPVLVGAGWLAHAQWWLLERMAQWPGAHWYLPEVRPWALALATLGALWLFAPRGLPLRWLGALLFLPLVWPPRPALADGAFQAWVLDVGQGLSMVVRTARHAMVYDAGAAYPSGFDLGEAVVLPSVHALGIARLDALVISHADNDHAGGAAAVAAAFPDAVRYAGEPEKMPLPMRPCQAGQAWDWDGVRFRVLHPPGAAPGKGNERSCVLQVEGRHGRLLLTGDIDARVESQLAATVADAGVGRDTVLLVPHHGSRYSSTPAFIAAARPALALVSAGWRNRFGHPHPQTMQRYATAGVAVWNTADSGAIALAFPVDAPPRIEATWRRRQRRYWREGGL
ncbi:DNA internalization-related competence protein ComEC/Rec2 [Frateuria defendens]|uniref:DNA internalization-related competence protein ComEC/Rec2 n=1 Tax=Frateuria defendens TaxID=2219559 RepID=UPI00066FBE59|nr:DNA internalization-related competence protein ComEC/Rec2 [Frateuria defendens]